MSKFSFDRQSKTYATNATLQCNIAQKLIKYALNINIKSILDLGAGSGNVVLNLSPFEIDYFIGVDISQKMLSQHPTNLSNIRKITLEHTSFEDYSFPQHIDLIISSSALHWAVDLDKIFDNIVKKYAKDSHSPTIAFSFFTKNSLSSLHSFLGTTSPLRDKSSIIAILEKYFVGKIHIESQTQHFSSTHCLLEHLKHCGLLGGGNISYKNKKKLRFDISLLDLEYEIIYFIGNIRRIDG